MARKLILCKASQGHDRELNLAAVTSSRKRANYVSYGSSLLRARIKVAFLGHVGGVRA